MITYNKKWFSRKYAIKESIPMIKKAKAEAGKQDNRKGKKIHLIFIFYAWKRTKIAQPPTHPAKKREICLNGDTGKLERESK